MNFVKASLKYRQVTFSVLFLMFAFGINSLINMPRREDPRITIPGGLIIAYFPGADAARVEDQVTKKLEEYLFRFGEIKREKTYTVTSDGKVVVHIWLEDKVRYPDIFWNKLRHQMLVVRAIDLPQGVMGPFINSDFGDTESMIIGIESEDADYTQLKEYAKKLEDKLRTVKAVSKIKRVGEQKEQILVSFSPEKLSRYNIDLQQVVNILQSQNTISPTGEKKTGIADIPLYTDGFYRSEKEIRNQVVGYSTSGAVIRLNDIADCRREYAEPESMIRINGSKALLVAIQMHEGKNIVRSGKEIERKVAEFSTQLPSNMRLSTIVNQPEIVDENISQFLREFLLAVFSVIIVVFLLLPLSIAAVAATAIPMTIAVTFGLMHIFGIELQQVSLASLIVVLGMVVDDAIVIADNYVALLDNGNDRWTAAWRSATDLVVPVLTATVTIIGSFLPLVVLTGAIGEFIRALPLTVTIALSSSFIVAMFLTPLLCFLLIRQGLRHPDQKAKSRKRFLLDKMQTGYDRSIEWCIRHSGITIWGSLATIFLAFVLFKAGIRQKFFPEAERAQFSVELWMPAGTSLEKTGQAISRIEKVIKSDKRVRSYTTFTGQSAPRFYYNYSPELPAKNYAQILINTVGKKETGELYRDLTRIIDSLVPEGYPHARLMQQGQPLSAPVEIRISGEDLNILKMKGEEIRDILRKTRGSILVRSDFREDYYGINIDLKEDAERLGFTTESIARMVYTGFTGYHFSSFYEGDNQVDITLRLDEKERQSTYGLEDIYLWSPVTGAKVPLRQIADLKPRLQTGRIIRRNGIRTLTIQSETTDGVLPSELLKAVRPLLKKIELPPGYEIDFGGEHANKKETYSYMAIALIISLIAIFLVLLFQFRNLKETGLVMLTIPLSLFGALSGLFITDNDFGFTAFVGLISLSGIVVRNAIILIDHTNELLGRGLTIPDAAYEAGKRRLRPIFLTAMAAAIGVMPMILSGSPLWSPLASVIAFGVIWAMIISTLAIPVLYIAVINTGDKKDKVETSNL